MSLTCQAVVISRNDACGKHAQNIIEYQDGYKALACASCTLETEEFAKSSGAPVRVEKLTAENAPINETPPWHGSVQGLIDYWKKRALSAEKKLAEDKLEAEQCVVIESPFASDDPLEHEANITYARDLMHDSLLRGECPFLSHLLYTQVLDDKMPAARELGIKAGLAIARRMGSTIVGTDRGISTGMSLGIESAAKAGRIVVERSLPQWKK